VKKYFQFLRSKGQHERHNNTLRAFCRPVYRLSPVVQVPPDADLVARRAGGADEIEILNHLIHFLFILSQSLTTKTPSAIPENKQIV
jgi:hypothetical protein